MQTSAHFRAKKLRIFHIYGISARKRWEGVNFSRFCVDVFYGRYLRHIAVLQLKDYIAMQYKKCIKGWQTNF